MASIPLIALQSKAPEAPDLLGQYGRLMQLKSMQQQAQMQQAEAPLRQQALQQQVQSGGLTLQQQQREADSQAAIMDAWKQANGNLGEAYGIAAKSGKATPQDLTQLQQAHIAMQKQAIDLFNAKGDAAVKEGDLFAGAVDAVKNAPPEARPQVYAQQIQQLQQLGVDVSQAPQQYPGDQALPGLVIGAKSHQAALNQVAKDAESQKNLAQANEATATANQKNAETAMGGTPAMADAKYRFLQTKIASGQPITPDDQAWIKGYEKQKLLVPQTTGALRIEGYAQSRMLPVYDTKQKLTTYVSAEELNRAKAEEPGRYTVASYTPEALGARDATNYFIQGKGGQQLTAFNTALLHLNTLDRLAGDLNNTDLRIANKAKQAWAEQTGSPAPANFAAAVNAMSGEVASALKASGATDQEIDKASSTFDKAQSPAQLKGAINTYRELLNGKASQLKRQYNTGMTGRPAFDNNGSAGGAAPAGNSGFWSQIPGAVPH